MPRELVSLAIGQAGLQLSNAIWELLCLEHGITPVGSTYEYKGKDKITEEMEQLSVFFSETKHKTYIPRCLLIDMEPTVIDEVKMGPYRQLYHPNNLIHSIEDAANNFARGYYTVGKVIIDPVLNQIRKITENCDTFQGFFFVNGLGGGTGSGFTCLLAEKLSFLYGKDIKISQNIFPGASLSTAMVENYNTVLACNSSMENTDINLTIDNEAVYLLCKDILKCGNPSYSEVNRIMAQCISNVTCSLRYHSVLNSDLIQLQTNIIPYPRIHFPIINFSPLLHVGTVDHSTTNTIQMTKDLFDSQNRMVCCDVMNGKFMACSLQYRGGVSPKDVNNAITDIKKNPKIRFVDWCPTGFKVGISSRPPMTALESVLGNIDRNVTMLANNTAIGEVFQHLKVKFNKLYHKNAFIHHYVGEGMEEAEFKEAVDCASQLIVDYQQAAGSVEAEVDGEK